MSEDDDEPAHLTRGQVRELKILLEDHNRRKWAMKLLSACAKWIIAVGAGVTTLQVGWSNLSKWLVK